MSMRALLQATRDHLRSMLGLEQTTCEVMFSGQPPPWAGEEFWAVHQRSWIGDHGDQDIDEKYGVDVTYSRRLNGIVPWDRAGVELLLKTPGGIYHRVEDGRVKLHKNYDLMNLANSLIDAVAEGRTNGFEEPYLLATVSNPQPQRATWFHGKPGSKEAGISMVISLNPARRLQELPDMT